MKPREARMFVALAFVVVVVAFVSAQGAQQPASSSEQQIREAAAQLLDAAQQQDKASLGRLVSDDATWIDRSGAVMTKSELIEGVSSGAPRAVDVEKVKLLASSALVTGVAHLADGRDARFLQQWVRQDGEWKLVGHQSSLVQTSPAVAAVGTTGRKGSAAEKVSTWRSTVPILTSKDEKDVWRTEMALQAAYLRGDAMAYSRLTANDYVRVSTDGRELNKAEFLEQVRKNAGKQGGDLKSNDVRIIVNGGYAREIMTIWGTDPGGAPLDLMRLTRYFKRAGGQWQQVAMALTKIPDE